MYKIEQLFLIIVAFRQKLKCMYYSAKFQAPNISYFFTAMLLERAVKYSFHKH